MGVPRSIETWNSVNSTGCWRATSSGIPCRRCWRESHSELSYASWPCRRSAGSGGDPGQLYLAPVDEEFADVENRLIAPGMQDSPRMMSDIASDTPFTRVICVITTTLS